MCPTPIGNLADITIRALDVLRQADVIACEDTRRTQILLERHALRSQVGRLLSLHEHNERQRAAQLVARVQEGALVALASDAGTPLISDPGFMVLHAAVDAGVAVEVLPGPSAPIVALVASGLPCDRFRFVGFLPRQEAALEKLLSGGEETLVAFESPKRLRITLGVLARMDPGRRVAVCRELTKIHEEIARGSAVELADRFCSEELRGEIVLVIGAPLTTADWQGAVQAFESLAQAGAKPRIAARVVAQLTGVRANELYRRVAGSGIDGR